MRLLSHLARTAVEIVRYGVADRRYGLVLLLVAAAVAIALTVTAQAVTPIVLYPFA